MPIPAAMVQDAALISALPEIGIFDAQVE